MSKPTGRPVGRPRKNGLNGLAPSNVATVEGQPGPTVATGAPIDLANVPDEPEAEERDEERSPELKDLPLFAGQTFGSSASPSYISVTRIGPVPEGHLGHIDITATEQEIGRRWGGGEYRLDARTAGGAAVPRGMKVIRVAGEPNIQSEGYRAEYARMVRNSMGLPPEARPAPAPPAAVVAPPVIPSGYWPPPAAPPAESMMGQLLVAMVQAQAANQQTMITVLTAAAQQREDSQIRMFDMLSKAQESKAAADPMSLLKEGMKLAIKLRGGEEEPGDPVSKFIDSMPGLLTGVKDIVHAEKAKPPDPAIMLERVYEALGARADVLFLEGDLGTAGNAALAHLEALGARKEEVLDLFFRQMLNLGQEELRAMGLIAPLPAPAEPPAPPETVPAQPIPATAQA